MRVHVYIVHDSFKFPQQKVQVRFHLYFSKNVNGILHYIGVSIGVTVHARLAQIKAIQYGMYDLVGKNKLRRSATILQ